MELCEPFIFNSKILCNLSNLFSPISIVIIKGLYGDDDMITAFYNHKKKSKRKISPTVFYAGVILILYLLGCVSVCVFNNTDCIFSMFNFLLMFSNRYGYIGSFFALFIPKFLLFLSVFLSGFFCFGKIHNFITVFLLGLFYGRFAGFLYCTYYISGVVLFCSCFLVFIIAISVLINYRVVNSSGVAVAIYSVVYKKSDFSINIKDYLIKNLITFFMVLLISLLQAFIFKIVMYIVI